MAELQRHRAGGVVVKLYLVNNNLIGYFQNGVYVIIFFFLSLLFVFCLGWVLFLGCCFLGVFFGLFVFAFILVLWFLSVCFCFLSSFSGFGFWGFFKF